MMYACVDCMCTHTAHACTHDAGLRATEQAKYNVYCMCACISQASMRVYCLPIHNIHIYMHTLMQVKEDYGAKFANLTERAWHADPARVSSVSGCVNKHAHVYIHVHACTYMWPEDSAKVWGLFVHTYLRTCKCAYIHAHTRASKVWGMFV
jgi:hypothetical protein